MIRADIETEELQYNMMLKLKKEKSTVIFDVDYALSA